MYFALPSFPKRAIVALVVGSACAAQAQQGPNQTKAKTKDHNVLMEDRAPVKVKTKAKLGASPEPVSPGVSTPQTVLGAPVVAPATSPAAPAGKGEWLSDLGAALALAKATSRPLVVVFSGSDWCNPCVVFEREVFSQPGFAAFAKDRLVLAHFDFPRRKENQPTPRQLQRNADAAAQLNREGDFPLAVIVSSEGVVLAKTGYIAGGPDAFKSYLKKLIPTL